MNLTASRELWQQVTGSGPDEAAKGMLVRFEFQGIMDEAKSAEEGRPVFRDVEFIEIRSPNDPLSIVHREVTREDRATYPQLYRAWKEGASEALTGTPLKEWTPLAASQAALLNFRGIRTLEQFVEVTDDGCHQMGHGYLTLRNAAQAWLAKAKDASTATKLAAELQARDSKIRALENQVADMAARYAERDEAAPAPKRTKQAQTA
jgi:hypothetical protein